MEDKKSLHRYASSQMNTPSKDITGFCVKQNSAARIPNVHTK